MSELLQELTELRRRDAEEAEKKCPVPLLRAEASRRRHHSLSDALRYHPAPRIIAEVKKASPSAGDLAPHLLPAYVASEYEKAGAAAISVLTEPHRFKGSPGHLMEVRAAVSLPVLRKDFISTRYQVLEAAAWGADAVLLIAAVMEPRQLQLLHRYARDLGLETLVEIHEESELPAALALEDAVIGVNSRNLKTLEVDLNVARLMAAAVPTKRISVAESGIQSHAEIAELAGLGYDGFLVGTRLMGTGTPARALRELLGG